MSSIQSKGRVDPVAGGAIPFGLRISATNTGTARCFH